MNSRERHSSDEENASFDPNESALENLKPGLVIGEQSADAAERHGGGKEQHHRFRRRDKKDIPTGSLAERIRKATEKGV